MKKKLLLTLLIQLSLISFDAFANKNFNLVIPVRTPLHWLIPNGASGCNVTFLLPDNKEINFSIDKEDSRHTGFSVELPYSTVNYVIKTKNDSLFFGTRCDYKAEFTLNELISEQWINQYPDAKFRQCIDNGLELVGDGGVVSYRNGYTNERKKLLSSFEDEVSQKIIWACQMVTSIKLETNLECTLSNGSKKSLCEQDYASSNDLGRRLSFKEAVRSALNGNNIVAGVWESDAGKSQRLEKEAKIKEQQEKEEARRKWLESPEGKKYLAEEAAKARKEEQEREREEASKKVYGSYVCFQEVFLDKLTDRTQKGADQGGFLFQLNGTVGVMSINNAASYSAGPWYFSFVGKRSSDKRGTAYYTYQVNDRFFRKIHLEIKDGVVVWMAQEADKAMMSGSCHRKSN